ncbi:restriction endonuclease [Stutzerimonas decontaminans]|uniref:Restriction endonuclease n=1 Tax=Stutzerimonas decontaminans TaxID=3022791 RepID=A0ABX4VSY0_9GAMM|nr:HNH endonuclease [Stutzerimonas decontaminans]MCQ4243895.1 HNH endonuclease [Stutzerimonas decontaminans]PNF83275.1 restriction endonuclease [Stutzerimonas decontaminans]
MASKPLKKHRNSAFDRQKGKCCYCGFQMWRDSPEAFAKAHGITATQARHFQCTAEHLFARQDGGKDEAQNIAAACRRCNQLRHQRKTPPEPAQYQQFVQKRLDKGGWHALPSKAKLARSQPPQLQVT